MAPLVRICVTLCGLRWLVSPNVSKISSKWNMRKYTYGDKFSPHILCFHTACTDGDTRWLLQICCLKLRNSSTCQHNSRTHTLCVCVHQSKCDGSHGSCGCSHLEIIRLFHMRFKANAQLLALDSRLEISTANIQHVHCWLVFCQTIRSVSLLIAIMIV